MLTLPFPFITVFSSSKVMSVVIGNAFTKPNCSFLSFSKIPTTYDHCKKENLLFFLTKMQVSREKLLKIFCTSFEKDLEGPK